MTDGDAFAPEDIARLAQLQLSLLPSSMVSRFGHAYARAFFRFTVRSPLECLTVERDASGRVIAGCVLSFDIGSLSQRLAIRTPLLFAAMLRPWVLLSAFGGDGASGAGETELVLLFTDPASQGTGAGRRLVERCDALARARGLSSYVVRTLADPANPAYRFYIARGFEPVGEFKAYGQLFALMRRALSA
jgi:ribosomal protein S18 acetylase RimI-like enzyme